MSHDRRIGPLYPPSARSEADCSTLGIATRQQEPRLGDMSAEDAAIKHDLEKLRRDGSVVARFSSAEEAAAWRAAMRRVCRTAQLRIRTGLANADDRIAWAWHVDHVVTEAESRAACRAIEAAYSDDQPRIPFPELVREEQRKMLRVVSSGSEEP
jgi:hypothetical protein